MKPDQKPKQEPFVLCYPSTIRCSTVGNLHFLDLASERLYEGASAEEMLIAACEGTIELDTGHEAGRRVTSADKSIFVEIADGIPDPFWLFHPQRGLSRPSEALLDQNATKPPVLCIGCHIPDPVYSVLPVETEIAGDESSGSSPIEAHVDPSAEERELYREYVEFSKESRLPPRSLTDWVRYYRERCPEEPTAQEREMYRRYVELVTRGEGVEPRSLEKWVTDYRKHQARPPTVDEQKRHAEYVEFVRGTSIVPRTLDDWVRDYRRHQTRSERFRQAGLNREQ